MSGRGSGRLLWAFLLAAPACSATKCDNRRDKSQTSSPTEEKPSAPAIEAVFADGPLRLTKLRVEIGGPGSPTSIQLRATAEVVDVQPGSVDIPVKIACRVGEHRVVVTSEMSSVRRKGFLLSKDEKVDAFAHAPTDLGHIGKPEACEITFVLEPDGKAKDKVAPDEEQVCWNGRKVVAGSCGFPAPRALEIPFALHHLVGELSPDGVEVRAYVQTRDGRSVPGQVSVEARCSGPGLESDVRSVMLERPFTLEAGESVHLWFEPYRAKPRQPGNCTLKFLWSGRDDEPASELGTWCFIDDGGRGRVPPAPKPGACTE
ncbi:MAG: hypothetical protein HOW73_02795 [Polyangiaceae bacterium]|nr:hypothetical protein [Polyangiaceae bacterium]